MPRKTDKRVRLIEAAKILIHQQGFNLTTLADIAQEADVPLGNVYYYFKTKEAIGEAVIEKRAVEFNEHLSRLGEMNNPVDRLMALLEHPSEDLELLARYGCAIGGLCQELSKKGGALSDQAAKLLHDILSWVEQQFTVIGFTTEKSKSYALSFIGSIQGMFLMMHTFKEPKLAEEQSENLKSWLKGIMTESKITSTSSTTATMKTDEKSYS
jgi:TetR/AcrR family transcriptional regulator, transcriptional repressor for nem operon